MYRVRIDDERPGSECWADFERGWDALEAAKSAARQGFTAEVWYDGRMEVSYEGHVTRCEA